MAVRVLLVDDVVAIRRLVRTALRFRGGFEVVGEAGDGSAAVRLSEELQPNVVVLDLGLPDLAGREVLSRIRAGSPRSKIVVFSGADPDDDEWIAQNVEGFVLKDEDLDYLVELLASLGDAPDGRVREEFGEHVSVRLPQALPSAAEARRFATQVLTGWHFESMLDDVLLVVSELAANAITHADSALELRLSHSSNVLRVEVSDAGAGTPEPQPRSTTKEHGRGLQIVDQLTSAWGMEDIPGAGKVVWAELARSDQEGGGAQPAGASSPDSRP